MIRTVAHRSCRLEFLLNILWEVCGKQVSSAHPRFLGMIYRLYSFPSGLLPFFLPHRAAAACLAISLRFSGLSFWARRFAPLRPILLAANDSSFRGVMLEQYKTCQAFSTGKISYFMLDMLENPT
jgi:hypothetical protein